MERMDRRGFLARTVLILLSLVAVRTGPTGERSAGSSGMEVGRTSRKRADHWKELAG